MVDVTKPTRLGAYQLRAPIASGGMGTVWLAYHVVTRSLVAVKVLSGTSGKQLEGFQREVQAVARLQHPRIIDVYDYGIITNDEAAEGLPAGTPWLAMELATRGSLVDAIGLNTFEVVRSILLDILDALSHSHARDIIHRDIKPGNILLTEQDGEIRCKVSDFGIAHESGESVLTREVFASSAGTPWYMSPEQIESRWRDYGAWTDLYAVGCLAYELVTGHIPFQSTSPIDVAASHLYDPPPKLRPRFTIPKQFESWVLTLLAKKHQDRFHNAADAAWALEKMEVIEAELPPVVQTPTLEMPPVLFDLETPALGMVEFSTPTPATLSTTLVTQTYTRVSGLAPTRDVVPLDPKQSAQRPLHEIPPIPNDWRSAAAETRGLSGAGLGLFGVRGNSVCRSQRRA